ncbi:MAG: hypothetical protein GY710_00445 [Desulfobacteraceae bacterium]|nr:hypothetical protein [Desulfobacteraceae bacterium]
MDQFSQPTPSEMRQLQEIADITMQTEPHLRNILDEIAIYTGYQVIKREDLNFMGGINSSVSFADGFLGGGLGVQKPKPINYSRLKLGPNNTGIMVDSRGYEVMEKIQSKTWGANVSLTLPGVTATLTHSHLEELPFPDSDGDDILLQLEFIGMSGIRIGNKTTPDPDPSSNDAFSKWIENNLLPAADKVNGAIPGWTSGFEGALKNKKLTDLAREYNLAVMNINFFRAKAGSEKKWVLHYWWANGGVGNSFEFTAPVGHGLNIVTGAEFSLNRSYWEHIGTNSMTYIQKAYDGFMAIPKQQAPNGGTSKTLRPDRDSGEGLWERFKEAHKNNFWQLGQNIGIKDSWVRKEVKSFGVPCNALIQCCDNLQGAFDQGRFTQLMIIMDKFLEDGAEKLDRIADTRWCEVHHMSESEKKFNQVSQKVVKQKDPLEFLNQAKALEMRMQPFLRQGYFSKDQSFTLDDCKQALMDGGYDMDQTFETLKSKSVISPDWQLQIQSSGQLMDSAIEACTHYIKDLDKASDWNFFQIRHRHGSEGVARATCLKNCLTIIKHIDDPQRRLVIARTFIKKYINSTLTSVDIDKFLRYKRHPFKDRRMYLDTLVGYMTALNGGGE